VREAGPIGDARDALVSIRSRDRLFDLYQTGVESPLGSRGYATMRASARFNTARVRVPAGRAWTWLRGVDVTAGQAGNR